MQDQIEEFWEVLADVLNQIVTYYQNPDETNSDPDFTQLLQPVQDKLELIDPVLCFAISPRMINMNDYGFKDTRYSPYLEKMNVVRYDLSISSSGDATKFDLIDQIISAGSEYEIPGDWNVVKLCVKQPGAETVGLIPSKPGEMISISMMEYVLQKQDDAYHLIMFLDDKLVLAITTQEEIYQLRNGVLLWLETIIGEYHTAKSIPWLTILPASEKESFLQQHNINQSTKNGVYLAPEFNELFVDNECRLCGISEINSNLTNRTGMLEYPYIDGILCEHCFNLLKNFRPMYIKLRVKFGVEINTS